MTHEDYTREETVKLGSERRFGQVFAVVFALIGAVTWWRHHAYWPAWLSAAAVILAVAYLVPSLLYWPNRIWLQFGLLLNKIIQPVVMALLFFIAVTPIALIMRLRGADLLRLKISKSAKTYWIERNRPPNSMSKQF